MADVDPQVERLPDDRLTGVLPRAFTYGLTGVVLALQAGAMAVEGLRRARRSVVIVRCPYGWALVVGSHRWDWFSPAGWQPLSIRTGRRGLRLGPFGVISKADPM